MLSGLPEDGGARGQVGKMGLPAQALETWVLRVGPLLSAAYPQDRVPRAGVSLCSGSSGPGGLCRGQDRPPAQSPGALHLELDPCSPLPGGHTPAFRKRSVVYSD